MSENLRRYTRALHGLDAVIRRTPADAWSNQSPCAEWTAADVVAHCIGMNEMIIGFTQGTGASTADEPTIDAPATAWRSSLENWSQVLDTDGALHSVAVTPWGEMSVERFLGFVWVDPLIHTWDLSIATGQEPALHLDLVERATAQLIKAGDSLRSPGRFGAAVELGDNASAHDKLAAVAGRTPES